ncbi:pyruvate dehydrogenase complex dihydrolipoamide acetyltransferase [Sphingomonas colocasiae]|uniref:Acetyltransferase component of pyruvate dehydrogenase complex n=1 Tax=Sphingomonas colocasiae TaxID=1848973 RepID=A0ABS7PXU4_9SPHN|nr:pyruvate dehydrogenase complex dihydrolipoamide acetyltransferase [Sphingomonas colocasiae]MBY8826038.1 pyruvate dehydrogenase complex dihydrolipoamide acetyltransferase [Sphingomonas colocasiae]
MPIELKMPALSPTMEEGTLAKWMVKEGDSVSSGDLLAEIETDKATMEFEAVDEGTIAKILVPEGSEGVKVGAVIALIAGEGEDAAASPAPAAKAAPEKPAEAPKAVAPEPKAEAPAPVAAPSPKADEVDRVKASPLARRLAEQKGVDLASVRGSGPGGRVVKADLDASAPGVAKPAPAAEAPVAGEAATVAAQAAPAVQPDSNIPSESIKLSMMRKTIARRMVESKSTVPHFYLTMDCNLDALLKLRTELNAGLESRGIKLSVNDLLIKALGVALEQVPDANVSFAGDTLIKYKRADISMAVAIPGGLITPIITDAGGKAVSKIAVEAKDLAARARDGKLQPHEYQGGTASISNLGMYGIKQFDAVVNPPQGMIMAVGAGEKRPYVVDDALAIATVMSATGSFDHRAIDGAIGAELMAAFKQLVEKPLGMVA